MDYHLTLTGPDIEMTYELTDGALVIGRDATCDIQLNHPRVLRRHLRIDITADDIQVTPLSRRSRIKRNDETLPAELPTDLSVGDTLIFAGITLVLAGSGAAANEQADATDETAADASSSAAIPTATGDDGGAPPNANLPNYLRNAPPPPPDYTREIPVGLEQHSIRYINYLPEIYRTDFTSRFIGLIEAMYMPVLWTAENFDVFLTPKMMPPEFLNWVSSWFGIQFDVTWNTDQRRTLLAEANTLYAQRGTKRALVRLLEIYTGRTPEVIDLDESLEPFEFLVRFPIRERDVNRKLIEQLIEANKPAHTTYKLEFSRKVDKDVMFSKLDF